MAKSDLIIRVRKFITNQLLQRKQFIFDIFSHEHENASKKDVIESLAKKYKVKPETVVVFGLQTKFGGARTSGFGFIYDNLDSLKKFETKTRMLRNGVLPKDNTPKSRRLKKENKNKVKNLRGKAKLAALASSKKRR